MFGRMLTAMVTPFDATLKLDVGRLERLINHLLATGTSALVVCGTTGESPTLSHAEKLQLFAESVRICAGRIPVIAGTGSFNTEEAIDFTKEVDALGVAGFLQVAPYYSRPSQEGLYQHFAKIADATNKPLLIYNIPGRTGVNISVETMVRLAAISNIIGVKESSGDFTQVSRMIGETPVDFAVYSGDDKYTLPILALGGAGVVSVASHIVGVPMNQMIDAFANQDTLTAARLHHDMMPLFTQLFEAPNPAPVKAALAMLDVPTGGVRLPLVDLTAEERRRLRKVFLHYAELTTLH